MGKECDLRDEPIGDDGGPVPCQLRSNACGTGYHQGTGDVQPQLQLHSVPTSQECARRCALESGEFIFLLIFMTLCLINI